MMLLIYFQLFFMESVFAMSSFVSANSKWISKKLHENKNKILCILCSRHEKVLAQKALKKMFGQILGSEWSEKFSVAPWTPLVLCYILSLFPLLTGNKNKLH